MFTRLLSVSKQAHRNLNRTAAVRRAAAVFALLSLDTLSGLDYAVYGFCSQHVMKRREIEQLEAAGLITPEQAAAIAEHFRLNGGQRWNWLMLSMCSLAGALILGGIIMLISANWESIPDLVKMAVAMVMLLGFWVTWWRMRETKPLIAEVFGLLGGGMWVGSIALYGQIFQLQNPFVEGCALFFVGVCAIPFLVRQRMLVVVVAVASAVLLGSLLDDSGSWLSLHSWVHRDSEVVGSCLLLCLIWWLLSEHWRVSAGFCRSYAWIGVVAILIFLSIVQVSLLYQPIRAGGGEALPILLLAVPLMLLWKPAGIAWKHWLLMLVLLSLAYPVGLMLSRSASGEIVGVLCGFGMGGGLMYLGYQVKRISWLNYGSLMVFYAGIALIANVLESLTGSGLVLIMAGLVMLGLVWLLEKQRRMLVRSIKEKA